MSDFIIFKEAVQDQIRKLAKQPEVFYSSVPKDLLWDTYLASFPEGTNPIYKERTEHDCNCCKQFIKAVGTVVSISAGSVQTVWDIDVGGTYQVVADALASLVSSYSVQGIYRHEQTTVGTSQSYQALEDKSVLTWDHLHHVLPSKWVLHDGSIPSFQGVALANKGVLQRTLEEISIESAETVRDLITQGSLYRGEEHLGTVKLFGKLKTAYDKIKNQGDRDTFAWVKSAELKGSSKIRNTVIGTLLSDISEGVDLEDAVRMFESKVAPTNYKRSSALITKGMIDKAQKKVQELGIEDSLQRRFAKIGDITVNNVLFADRSAKKNMGGVFEELKATAADKQASPRNFDKIEEVGVEDFINNILPNVDTMEVVVENSQVGNLVSLIAPESPEAAPIFKWGNNFSWSYQGEVTDSIKERVKKAGGNVEGDLRTSLSWFNYDDLDIHVEEPDGTRIFFSNKISRGTGGKLDVDMNAGSGTSREAVENITWPRKSLLKEGTYTVKVHNYSKREASDLGFEVELDFLGDTQVFYYPKGVKNTETVKVVEFSYSHKTGVTVLDSIPHKSKNKEVWGIKTLQLQKVSTIMYSPNHWDGEETGNKHYFFMLEGCVNPDKARGFYNEFLKEELTEHRKVFEVLGSKMKTEETTEQLSGLGFSSTQRNSILCKVSGSFNRMIKINF